MMALVIPVRTGVALENCSEKLLRDLGVAIVACEEQALTCSLNSSSTNSGVSITGVDITVYSPQEGGDNIEGGYESSRKGLDGEALVRTLDDFRDGTSQYVTLAGDPAQYEKTYIIPELTYDSYSTGQKVSTTLNNVKVYVHDTGSAFTGEPEGRYDVAVGKDYTDAQMNSQPFANHSDPTKPKIELIPFDNQASASLGFDPLTLRYPEFTDEATIIQNLKNYITNNYPNSPFASNLQYVDQIFETSKRTDRNINPLLVVSIAKQENGFGQANSSATENNNYFGITNGPRTYRQFATVEEGIDYFVEKVSRHVSNPDGAYLGLSNFYEYLSIHQVGLIAYPGEYPDGSLGKDEIPPYLTYDERMDVYTSWDITRNSHKTGSPVYNPGIYFRNSINLINELTGLNLSTEPQRGANLGRGGACGGTVSTGEASTYIDDCNANNGNAAIACTAINQLMGLPYSREKRAPADDPNPEFLDCSALTGMAIYRTFGVNLNGLCSVGYLSNSNFEIIDVHEVQAGDLIGKGTICGEDSSGVVGHIAIVVSYDFADKKLITVETGSTNYLSGIRGNGAQGTYNVGFAEDGNGNYTWAVRYIGDKTLQPGAL